MSHAVRNKKQLLGIYKKIMSLLLKTQIVLILKRLVTHRKGGMNSHKMRKERRSKGKPYVSAKGYLVPGKMMKPKPCSNCNLGCSQISEDIRLQVFSLYCKNLTAQQQQYWICSHTEKFSMKQRTNAPSEHNYTYN
jgi:hypothetical protein